MNDVIPIARRRRSARFEALRKVAAEEEAERAFWIEQLDTLVREVQLLHELAKLGDVTALERLKRTFHDEVLG